MTDKLSETPRTAHVDGKSGKLYIFKVYNIDDEKIDLKCGGIYIFTKKINDENYPPENKAHLYLCFDSIYSEKDNSEAIKKARENGAEFIFYYPSMSEHERQNIIADIKATDYYEKHLMIIKEIERTT